MPNLTFISPDTHANRTYVRRTDWEQAINEHKKVHLLGEAAVEAHTKEKQTLADALPAKTEVLAWFAYDSAHSHDSISSSENFCYGAMFTRLSAN